MVIGILKHASVITGFVLIMMLVIEYINVQTRGTWHRGPVATHYFCQSLTGRHVRCAAGNSINIPYGVSNASG